MDRYGYDYQHNTLNTDEQIHAVRVRQRKARRNRREQGGRGGSVAVPTRQAPMDPIPAPIPVGPFKAPSFVNLPISPPTKRDYETWVDFARRLYRIMNHNDAWSSDNVIADWYERVAPDRYKEMFDLDYPKEYKTFGRLVRQLAQMRMQGGQGGHGGHGAVPDVRHGAVYGAQHGGVHGFGYGHYSEVGDYPGRGRGRGRGHGLP